MTAPLLLDADVCAQLQITPRTLRRLIARTPAEREPWIGDGRLRRWLGVNEILEWLDKIDATVRMGGCGAEPELPLLKPRPGPPERVRKVYLATNGVDYKIGIAFDLRSRMIGLANQCGHHVELIAHFLGGRQEEAELHETFSDLRLCGEWFTVDPRIIEAFRARGAVFVGP
jgi:hypothetical protein